MRAGPYDQTEYRRSYGNGSYTRQLITHVATLDLEVPSHRKGRFQTSLVDWYQRPEMALVLALMPMLVQSISTRHVKKSTPELCGREFTPLNRVASLRKTGRTRPNLGVPAPAGREAGSTSAI